MFGRVSLFPRGTYKTPVYSNNANNAVDIIAKTEAKLAQGFGENTAEEKLGLNFIKDKLTTCNGVILGDGSHFETLQHDFVARNIDELKNKGVEKIYLEFLSSETAPVLDKFYRTGKIDNLVNALTGKVCNPETILALIKTCREKGIRCHELDLRNDSVVVRNNFWAEKVKETNPDNKKYVLIGGSAHLSRTMGQDGIDKLLSGKIAVLETVIPTRIIRGDIPANYITCGDNYSILTYRSR